MSELSKQRCVPCRGGIPPLTPEQIAELKPLVHPNWDVVDHHHLARALSFPDFATGLAFVNRVGAIAEEEGHHPDLYLAWGRVRVEIYTHAIGGLAWSDFVLAAKIDEVTS